MSAAVDPLVLAKQGDERPQDGALALCEGCGAMIRWITTEKGKRVPVAPYRMRGQWRRPLAGYGEGRGDGKRPETFGLLYVLPVSAERAARSKWLGGAKLYRHPPGTVWGYRPHHADCPKAGQFGTQVASS